MLPAHLAESIRKQVLFYLQSTFEFRDSKVSNAFRDFVTNPEHGLFKGPWVQVQRPFRPGPDQTPPFDIDVPFRPFAHQWQSWQRLSSKDRVPQSTLVTTGTGSGKTECFLYPVLDHCLRARRAGQRGIKALILYPMNALAADQEKRMAKAIWEDSKLRSAGITVGTYTGRFDPSQPGASAESGHRTMGHDHGLSNHQAIQADPPDILLTNYKMLDFLLLRPADQKLWRFNAPEVLRYLVMDELHTYDGAQGADVACLIRRLKERLDIERGQLCVVGTSATLDSRSNRGTQGNAATADAKEGPEERLARFARTLFEEDVQADSVIGEDRLGVEQIVLPEDELHDAEPPASDELEPKADEDAVAFAQRQSESWGGPSASSKDLEAWSIELGSWLKCHRAFAELLRAFSSAEAAGPMAWNDLVELVCSPDFGLRGLEKADRDRALVALLAMVSQAKELKSGKAFPLAPLQVQLWIRELRRIGRTVGEKARFVWLDDQDGNAHSLPVYCCKGCGDSGWLALRQTEEDDRIQALGVDGMKLGGEPSSIYQAWFTGGTEEHGEKIVILSLWDDIDEGSQDQRELPNEHWYVHPGSLVARKGVGRCPITEESASLRIKINRDTRTDQDTNRRVGVQVCPGCGGKDTIFIVGSQASTLSSVAIDELFGSVLNSDPKLLAFTDSVQDASHRAGFFSARTYHFTLRTAIQHMIDEAGAEGVLLEHAGEALLRWWAKERPGWKGSLKMAISALLPPDLATYPEWRELRDSPGVAISDSLYKAIAKRLDWEVYSEFGLMQIHGRSLERCGCATVVWDESRLESAIDELTERLPKLDRGLHSLEREQLRLWILGLLQRARLRGAVAHYYIESTATSFWGRSERGRTRDGRELFPPAGRYTPRLIVNHRVKRHDHLLAASPRSGRSPWGVDWSRRSLNKPGIDETALVDLLALWLRVAPEVGLLKQVAKDGATEYFAIDPAAARLVSGGIHLQCTSTRRSMVRPESELSLWLGKPSLEYAAEHGTNALRPAQPSELYYQDRYRKGALRRVVAEEHTGLLTTEEREQVERRFAGAVLADDPNLLTCTSTLEMGIDIGDLSSTMLCSVPPSTASYLQRIGRAGRATGTALILAIVNQRPHDLFFFGRPDELLRGQVDPPGCWLDAAAVLVRQYLAFCFDAGIKEGVINDLPASGRQLVDDLAHDDGLIPTLVSWVVGREAELQKTFLDRFRDDIQDDTRARFVDSVSAERLLQQIRQASEDFDQMRRQLANAKSRLKDQLGKLDPDDEDGRIEIEREQKLLKGRSLALSRTRALEILTDHGLLPNYAFPERGVRFYGAVYNRHRKTSSELAPIEITRAAKASLRELAPGNHFYTHSRVFDIQQLSMGSPQQPITAEFAVCASCGHMRPSAELDDPSAKAACPQCGDPDGQHEIAQRRTFLELPRSQAMSFMEHYESLSGDRSDDRKRQGYQILHSFDLTAERPSGAVGEHELPFGIEYRAGLVVRDLNVGYLEQNATVAMGVDQKAPEEGFRICANCGIAEPQRSGSRSKPNEAHRRSCSARRRYEKLKQEGRATTEVFNWQQLYLYRELRSEAVRLLIPFTDPDDLANLSACLYLGLKLRFGGNPSHLEVLHHVLPDRAKHLDRHFLVLVDEVPGGTGYLKALYQQTDAHDRAGEGIVDILRRAKVTLETCSCRNLSDDDEGDGCYRCIRSYQQQYEAESISRERSIEILDLLLSAADRREEINELQEIRSDSLLQSVLEKKFLDRLRNWVTDAHGIWERTIIRGARGYRFRLPNSRRLWELELQARLGAAQGVAVACQPDFVLRCSEDEVPDVAIFTDGFEFHCHPNNRLADDLRKRRALLESGVFKVWSLTWKDVSPAEDDPGPQWLHPAVLKKVSQREASFEWRDRAPRLFGDAMSQLLSWIELPDADHWQEMASFAMGWPLTQLSDRSSSLRPPLAAAIEPWGAGVDFSSPEHDDDGTWVVNPRASLGIDLLALSTRTDVLNLKLQTSRALARLGDSDEEVASAAFQTRWRAFLSMCNVLQFLGSFTIWATSEVEADTAPRIDLAPPGELSTGWQEVIDLVIGRMRALTQSLGAIDAPLPEVDYELADVREELLAELAWPDRAQPVAVLAGGQALMAELWRARGWLVFDLAVLDTNGPSALKAAIGEEI